MSLGAELCVAGVRQVVTGSAELRRRNGTLLCTSMCVGSGMGAASIIVNEASFNCQAYSMDWVGIWIN